jgi:hypothetical protein
VPFCFFSFPGWRFQQGLQAADLIVSDTLQLTVPATYDNVIVQSTGLLVVDAPLTVLGNMRIEAGGVVTHTLQLEAGLALDSGKPLIEGDP